MANNSDTSREWQPGTPVILAWNLLGLGLVIIGIAAFGGLYAWTHEGDGGLGFSVSGALGSLLVTLLLIVAIMILHEWIHGQVMRQFGAHPTYGAGIASRVMPYFSCTAKGHRFGKRQFLIVALAPSVVISALCALAIMLPFGGWLVAPAAIHLGGCIGDFWVSGMVAGKPDDMRFEDTITGIRFHPAR